jgi:hypothetical protein
VDQLLPGASIVVEVVVDYGGCTVEELTDYINTATARAINADEVQGVSGFEQVLPVELISFEALLDGRDALLHWETASETNNAGFEIQHREATVSKGEVFEVLGWIGGFGTTEATQRYDFRIEALTPGRHLFRLKQMDYDGTFDYSPEIEVAVEMPESFLMTPAYPNPFNPQANFSVSVKQTQKVVVSLFNVVGQQVGTFYDGVLPGGTTRSITIDGSTLQSGMYLLRVQGERFVDTQTVTLLK